MSGDVKLLRFDSSQGIPNHPSLPVVVSHGVLEIVGDPGRCEEVFARHGWGGSWRDGVFPFHHFHSNAHEVLGFVAGETTVLLGGPDGESVRIVAGDVVVLPAGTGHKRESASDDLLVVGAYPAGQENFDLRRGDPDEFDEVSQNIASVALPALDPSGGEAGPLIRAWSLPGR